MKIDIEFKTLLIKLIFCNDNFSYKAYGGALVKTKTMKKIISYTLDKVNLYKKTNITLDSELSFSVSNDDQEVLDLYISIGDTDVDIDQIMVPIKLEDIKNQPQWALLFPGEEEIELNLKLE